MVWIMHFQLGGWAWGLENYEHRHWEKMQQQQPMLLLSWQTNRAAVQTHGTAMRTWQLVQYNMKLLSLDNEVAQWAQWILSQVLGNNWPRIPEHRTGIKTRKSRVKRVARNSTRLGSNSLLNEPSWVFILDGKRVQVKRAEFRATRLARLTR